MTILLVTNPLEVLRADVLVFCHFEDLPIPRGSLALVDWTLNAAVSRLSLSGHFTGAAGRTALLNAAGKFPTERIALLGMGRATGLTLAALTTAGRTAAALVIGLGCREVAVGLPFHALPGGDPVTLANAFQQGFTLAGPPAIASLRFLDPTVAS